LPCQFLLISTSDIQNKTFPINKKIPISTEFCTYKYVTKRQYRQNAVLKNQILKKKLVFHVPKSWPSAALESEFYQERNVLNLIKADEFMPQSIKHHADKISGVGFFHDPLAMGIDGTNVDREPFAYFTAIEFLRGHRDDIYFPRGKRCSDFGNL